MQTQVTFRSVKVSTTLIKKLLLDGDITLANECLDHKYFLEGYVAAGHSVGKQLGFPTANVEVPEEKLLPKNGVYSGTVNVGGQTKKCVINIGGRPTFHDGESNVEVHILDFDGDLYFKQLKVSFVKRLRDIIKFNSKEELIKQIKADVKRA
jgi:riboflavin kinase/FMN adenylyltransferase